MAGEARRPQKLTALSVLALFRKKAWLGLRPVPLRIVGCRTSRSTLAWSPRGGLSRVYQAAMRKCRLGLRERAPRLPGLQSMEKTPASPSSCGLWGPGSHPWPLSLMICPLGVSWAAQGQGRVSGSHGSWHAVARSRSLNSAAPRDPHLGLLSSPAASERATQALALEAAFPGPPQVRGHAQGQCCSERGLGKASQRRQV